MTFNKDNNLAFSIIATSLAAMIAMAQPSYAQNSTGSIVCGEQYTIKGGDTLSKIAERAYGKTASFQLIYSANARTIGPNPALITSGSRIDIPCPDAISASVADSAAIRTVQTSERLPLPDQRKIRAISASDWAPFTDEDQEQGGMITEILNQALANSANQTPYKIDFINDAGAHLQPLISDHAYDFSIGWYKPNCDKLEKFDAGSKFRCNNLDWSEPMFEHLVGYYNRISDPALENHSDLLGKTICRPSGFATFMMEENDLKEPYITLVREQELEDCFIGLVDGRYDGVVLSIDSAEGAMTSSNTVDQVRYNESLSQTLTIHAVISNTNPDRERMLAELDSGIKAIKDSGEWFEIVKRHLSAHHERTRG